MCLLELVCKSTIVSCRCAHCLLSLPSWMPHTRDKKTSFTRKTFLANFQTIIVCCFLPLKMLRLVSTAALFGTAASYDNGAPNSKLPVLGWSSWVSANWYVLANSVSQYFALCCRLLWAPEQNTPYSTTVMKQVSCTQSTPLLRLDSRITDITNSIWTTVSLVAVPSNHFFFFFVLTAPTGWAGSRNAPGYLVPETDLFPNGMKKVVDYAHSYVVQRFFSTLGR